MAGAGAKKFPAFSKLTSDDVNNYLADQVIMRFATTAARDAAYGGVGEPTLAEGMTAYIDNLNVLQTYDGSNWITTTALQTTADVSAGLVYIAQFTLSGLTTNLTNIFSATYENYRLVVSGITTGAALVDKYQMLNGSTPANGANYNNFRWTTSGAAEQNTGQTSGFAMTTGTTAQSWIIEVFNPAIATKTNVNASGQYGANADIAYPELISSVHTLATAYDGMSLVATATTFTAGKVTVYGYRKA